MRRVPQVGEEIFLAPGVVRHGVDVTKPFRVTFVDAGFLDKDRVEVFIEQDVPSKATDGNPLGTMSTMVELKDLAEVP